MAALLPDILAPTLDHLGLVRGMSNEDYQAAPGLSCSGLKWLARSPAHYFAWCRDSRAPKRERGGQREGTLAHCMVLEPGEYPFRYAVGPEVATRASTDWKAFERAHSAFTCIKPSEAATAQSQADSVRRDADTAALLAVGDPEVSAFWRDSATGVLCRCRPDWVHPIRTGDRLDSVILLDLKTYSDASPAEFARQVARKHYHWQAAFYTDGYSRAAGVPVVGFVFVAVETEWPYLAKATMLDEQTLDLARREIRPLVELYARCEESGSWPGYAPGIAEISLPRWYSERLTDEESGRDDAV